MGRPDEAVLFTRFWSRVGVLADPSECWLWLGPKGNTGYGVNGKKLAHRQSWEFANGIAVPPGMVIDHLCRTSLCVRPDHLQAVPQLVNVRRGLAWNHDDRCIHGHALTPENVYWSPSRGRRCRKCHTARESARRARIKAGS